MKIGNTKFDAGIVSFALQYRALMPDQGVSLQVVSCVDGEEKELLRFDCFDQNPHYHYDPNGRNIRYDMDKTTAGNPVGWTLKQLRGRLPEMLKKAGYEDIANKLDCPLVLSKLDQVEEAARYMAVKQRRTVTHNRGDVIIEAGNIRFGLEFRELAADRGMAIHVLSDVAGQEIELLAFDCFEEGPHYHYGPRNQDVRIYWDKAVVPDTLQWTLDQFKGGKLPSMLERAGYPTIAAALDRELVIEKVTKEVEPKAMAMRAAHAK
ncbi:MAG TPA: hypothetical protein VNP04_22790 [Alphaproteobacteria bacterium]|nr:hypothetical protein [Alphaproteobacteria bacterium]